MLTAVCASTLALSVLAESNPLSFSFPGGTVTQYVEAVRAIKPDLNVIVDEEVRDFRVPAFRLSIGVEGPEHTPASRLIEEVLPTIVVRRAGHEGPVELLDISIADFGDGDDASRLYTVNPGPFLGLLEEMDRRYMVPMALGPFIQQGMPESDLLAALEASLGAAVAHLDAEEWSIRYHEATRVAFVMVPLDRREQASFAVGMLTDALAESLRPAGERDADHHHDVEELEAMLEEREADLEEREFEIQELQNQLEELQRRHADLEQELDRILEHAPEVPRSSGQ